MIFGSRRDANLLLHIDRELLQDIVEQEVLYYKIDLEGTEVDIYGESENKGYCTPVRLVCLIKRGDQDWGVREYGPDVNRSTSFAFIKDDCKDLGCLPEVGDIIEWDKNYYEVDGVKENQLWLGKNQDYRLDDRDPRDRTWKFGSSVSIVCSTHLTRYSKLNITSQNA